MTTEELTMTETIQRELDALTADVHDGEFSDGEDAGSCTVSARKLQRTLGGIVAGYWQHDNPTADMGNTEGGHDFLVLPAWDLIVDWWAHYTYGKPAILHRVHDRELVNKLYGDPANWVVWKEIWVPFEEVTYA
jgi:hypothetical protein